MIRRLEALSEAVLALLFCGLVGAAVAYAAPSAESLVIGGAAPRAAAKASAAASVTSAASARAQSYWKTASGKKPQFIVFAFDGSRSLAMWERTRAFAREMNASSTPVHFTYFINAAYFVNERDRAAVHAPHHEAGESAIGFGGSDAEISARIGEVNAAYSEGNEIGSHTVAHYSGASWSKDDWLSEFDSFDRLLFSPARGFAFGPEAIAGFRAPELGTSPGLFQALPERGFRYDASLVGDQRKWPYKTAQGLWEFPLGSIDLGGITALSMDYSIYMTQTGGQSLAAKGTPLWNRLHAELMKAYEDSFEENYAHSRAPLYVAHHFSEWNDGLYWEAMKDFAREECSKAEVHCVTYRELADALDAMPAAAAR